MNRDELERRYAAAVEIERRTKEAPILRVTPSPKQREVIDSHKKNRVTLMIGSNKCGKTYIGTALDWSCSVGYYIFDVPGLKLTDEGDLPPRDEIPPRYWVRDGRGMPIPVPNVGMIVTGLARERGIGEVLWPCLEGHAPLKIRERWRIIRGPGGIVTRVYLPNGSSWLMASTDQDPLTFEGTRIQWAHCDEPVPPFVFNGIWRGLALDHGKVHFTLTPLGTKATWMHIKWCAGPTSDAGVVRLRMLDNPIMTQKAVDDFANNLECDEAERRARLYGDFEALGNRVIYNFNKAAHVIPARALPVGWLSGCTYDPHHAKPPFIAWWKRDANGVYHFYREYPNVPWNKAKGGALTPTQIAILCRNVEGRDVAQVRIGDPRFGKAEFKMHGQAQSSWAELMDAAGMYVDTRVPNIDRVETGEQLIVDMLRYDTNFPISPSNTPKILIHDSCPNIITAFENYGILANRDPTRFDEKRSEEWKDPVDVVRYTVLYDVPDNLGGRIEMFSDRDLIRENNPLPE